MSNKARRIVDAMKGKERVAALDLAHELQINESTLRIVLAELVRAGYLDMWEHEADTRRKWYALLVDDVTNAMLDKINTRKSIKGKKEIKKKTRRPAWLTVHRLDDTHYKNQGGQGGRINPRSVCAILGE